MSVTTSQRINPDKLAAQLGIPTEYSVTGARLDSMGEKTISAKGLTDQQLAAVIAAAAAAFVDRDANVNALLAKVSAALAANTAYLASTPTQAQSVAQVQALTRQTNALIRLLAQVLDSTAGT